MPYIIYVHMVMCLHVLQTAHGISCLLLRRRQVHLELSPESRVFGKNPKSRPNLNRKVVGAQHTA